VFGLCGAGCRSPEDISGKLHIHPQLTSLILEELRRKRLIDREGNSGRAAERFTLLDLGRSDSMMVGWVFQDLWSGDLWPRFVMNLDYCQTDSDSEGFVKLLLGSTGDPWLQRAFMQLPPRDATFSRPTPLQVLRAAEAHRRALKRARESETLPDEPISPAETARVERIGLIESQARPVFLMTYLYLPGGERGGSEWYVCEPFGFDPSAIFRRDLENRLTDSPGLRAALQRLLEKSVHGDSAGYRAWRERMHESAVFKVDLELTAAARSILAYDHLVEMEEEYEMAREDQSAYALRNAATACRRALEALFRELAAGYPLKGVSLGLYVNGRPNNNYLFVQACYRQAASAIGLSPEMPRQLLSVRPEHVRAVAEYDNCWRLNAFIIATLLRAAEVPDHPLRVAAQKVPDLLDQLNAVVNLSGDAAHAGGFSGSLDDVRLSMRTVYRAVGLLLSLSLEGGST